ncbi:hypothetical protein [Halovivax limisalsi]|uniref:hypothetical protein n=1 Tax=Halovivax limisalsi TaxID=1453760 RepID=UPI001FFC8F3E|nr:hypothetical protein [Halovivax limisalsi]
MGTAERIASYRDAVVRWIRARFGGSRVAEWAHGLYHGMVVHPAAEKLEQEAEDLEDAFMVACFPDAFGIPSPVSYYAAELLPFLGTEFTAWERRMWDRSTLIERKGRQYHF